MLLRPLSLSLLALSALAAPAAADRLLVAGQDGFVVQADMEQGSFTYFACACAGGPIDALAHDGQRLYAAGSNGQISVSSLATGDLQNIVFPEVGGIVALAAADGTVFAGTAAGLIATIDPLSGAVLDTRTLPTGVNALLVHKGFLLAAGSDGAIYRAKAEQGAFEYFTCFCFFDIRDLTASGGEILAGDGFGTVARIDPASGNIQSVFSVGQLGSMTAGRDALLVYYGPEIPRFNLLTGQQLAGGFTSPIDVGAMLVVRDTPPRVRQAPAPQAR